MCAGKALVVASLAPMGLPFCSSPTVQVGWLFDDALSAVSRTPEQPNGASMTVSNHYRHAMAEGRRQGCSLSCLHACGWRRNDSHGPASYVLMATSGSHAGSASPLWPGSFLYRALWSAGLRSHATGLSSELWPAKLAGGPERAGLPFLLSAVVHAAELGAAT